MEKIEVAFKEEVIIYLENLVLKLLHKKYFNNTEESRKYVYYIFDQIVENIHTKKHHSTPQPLLKYGKYYIVIVMNKRTAWHIYFTKKESRYMINRILNNHLPTAQFLNDL